MAKQSKRKWHYAGPLRNWPAGSWTRRVERKIRQFWDDTYNDEGVRRTIKIGECDRKRVSRELAEHLLGKK